MWILRWAGYPKWGLRPGSGPFSNDIFDKENEDGKDEDSDTSNGSGPDGWDTPLDV